jgi:CheY-like chemotaxis protein
MRRRLERLALVEAAAGGWRLTPLGRQRCRALPAPPLRLKAPPVIDRILDRYIPLARATGIARPADPAFDEPSSGEPSYPPPGNPAARRVLVVEDCYVEAQALARLLESSGLEVVGPVGRLDQAISIAADRELDGALLDIDLGGEPCFPVAVRLRQRHVPVAFVSAHAPTIVPRDDELRAVPFIAKPFEDHELLAAVKNAIETAPPQ